MDIDDVIQDLINDEAKKQLAKTLEKKKPVSSGRKGKTWERDLCKVLARRFDLPFSRTPGSGGFATSGKMDERAKNMMSSDIIVPDGFRFLIEAKKGYNIDLSNMWMLTSTKPVWFQGGRLSDLKKIVGFIAQSMRDANRCGKDWMVMWRSDGRPPSAICGHCPRSAGVSSPFTISWTIRRQDWTDVESSSELPDEITVYFYSLSDLLNLPNEFWFEPDKVPKHSHFSWAEGGNDRPEA